VDENWESGVEKTFSASVSREENPYVAQCLEIDVASQGTTEDEALQNLREALELHFDPPQATNVPLVKTIKVEVGAA
jgi:predicted RNase H-like HicB family nuclease